MKRDMDLIRTLLLKIESFPNFPAGHSVSIEGYSKDEINFHLYLLGDAGLIHSQFEDGSFDSRYISSLTWKGCEFLDAARDNKRWEQAKNVVGKIGANVFEILMKVLIESAISQITLPR